MINNIPNSIFFTFFSASDILTALMAWSLATWAFCRVKVRLFWSSSAFLMAFWLLDVKLFTNASDLLAAAATAIQRTRRTGISGHWPIENDAKSWKMTETLAHGYSSESTLSELSEVLRFTKGQEIISSACLTLLTLFRKKVGVQLFGVCALIQTNTVIAWWRLK